MEQKKKKLLVNLVLNYFILDQMIDPYKIVFFYVVDSYI